MKKKKLILTCTLLGLFTSGVFASQGLKTQSKSKSLQGAVSEDWAKLGAPTLNATGMPIGPTICMNTNGNIVFTSPSIALSFSNAASNSNISRALNLKTDNSGNISTFVTAGAGAEFTAGATDTDYTYNLTYLYAYSANASLKTGTGDSNLSSAGQAALAAGNDMFFQTCGDSFVGDMNAGVVLGVNVGITFNSKEDKLKFLESANLTAKAKESANITLSQSIDYAESSLSNNAVVTVSAIQKGGTPDKLAAIFGNSGFTSCSSGKVSECSDLISKVNSYATNLNDQIMDKDRNMMIADRLYYFSPTIYSYSSIGLRVSAPQGLSEAAASAQVKVSDALTTAQSRIDFLNHYKADSLPLQSDVNSYIAAQIQELTNQVNYIKSKAIDCFNAQAETCPAIVQNIETTFKNSTSTYSFDIDKYGQLNSSWSYILNGKLTHLVPVSFANTFATHTTDAKTNNRIVQAYEAEENGVSYISRFDIPYANGWGVVKTYKCLPASGDNKFAKTRTFTCKNGWDSADMQFTKRTDSPL
ncbi:MAG: hypothetical protein EKK54_12055 [Neisseriaceae bacterium]|nr:MAG: hypothetical protein EKK54_12055 [Neisseriaceae bacterium]